jgi:hypothetical protein
MVYLEELAVRRRLARGFLRRAARLAILGSQMVALEARLHLNAQ